MSETLKGSQLIDHFFIKEVGDVSSATLYYGLRSAAGAKQKPSRDTLDFVGKSSATWLRKQIDIRKTYRLLFSR